MEDSRDILKFDETETVVIDCDRNATEVIIPYGVNDIDEYAFSHCSLLVNIEIPNSVIHIGHNAFYDCSSLFFVYLPDSVKDIVPSAFDSCTSLFSIYVDGENDSYKDIDGILFSKDGTKLIKYPTARTETQYQIPNDVTYIEDHAFSGCSSLNSIYIPKNVTYIGKEAFLGCSTLSSIDIPNGVTSIGNFTFLDCM